MSDLNDIFEKIETLTRCDNNDNDDDDNQKLDASSLNTPPHSLPNIWLDNYWLKHNENIGEQTPSLAITKSDPIYIQKRQRKKVLNEVIDEYAVLNSMPDKLDDTRRNVSMSSHLQVKSPKKQVNFNNITSSSLNLRNNENLRCCCCCCCCKECQQEDRAYVYDDNLKLCLLDNDDINKNLNKEKAITIQNSNQAFVDINNCNANSNECDLDKSLQFDLDNNIEEECSLFGVALTDKKSQNNNNKAVS